MIFVSRVPEPEILRKNKLRWQHDLDTAITQEEKEKAQEKYRHKDIQKALRDQMFQGKCAYCEAYFEHAAHGHIEHFWPKAHYPGKTFDWENLVWACPICNGDKKGDYFPLNDGLPVLVDPTQQRPEEHFAFIWDEVAQVSTVVGKTQNGFVSEKVYDLNRDDIRRDRDEHLRLLASVIKLMPSSEATEILNLACRASAKYAAFARALIGKGLDETALTG